MMISQAGFDGKTVKIHIRKRVVVWEAPAEVLQVMSTGWRVLVVLDYMDKQERLKHRNVFCLNWEGGVEWQIQSPQDAFHVKSEMAVFTGVALLKGNRLVASTFDCYTYEIDIETGKLSNPKQGK